MDIFVARQPIFDRQQRIYGYELLYRAGMDNFFNAANPDDATLAVIRNVMLVLGSENLSGGKRVFVNFTKSLLLSETPSFLPKNRSVIEILEDVEVDEELLAVCQDLKNHGYQLALDDFIWEGNEPNPLTEVVHFIKVDFRNTLPQDRKAIAEFFNKKGVELLAEKTETRQEFQEALAMGFSYFQGYFFSKPEIISGKDIPGYKLHYLRILKEVCREDIDFKNLQEIIERDPPLCLKILTYLNSAFFGLRYEITSIGHALALLGEKEIRRWASLAILVHLGKDQPTELMRLSILRAKFCESLAPKFGLSSHESKLFLMGLLSFMDVFWERPLEEILEYIPLAKEIKQALLGQENIYRRVLDLVVHYEKGDWESVSQLLSQLNLAESDLPEIYTRVIEFAESIPLTNV